MRKKQLCDVRRLLLRHLYTADENKVEQIRDLVWDALITRRFARGDSVEEVALLQPTRSQKWQVEGAIRREMRRRSVR